MASTFSPNLNLELVGRGDQVGVWDTPENSDWSILDRVTGGIATISLNNSPVVLASAQFQSKQITFNSTLTGSCTITFPTSFTKSYEIQNACTGSSAFVITLATTAAGGQAICCPPGEIIDCVNDGTNIKFKNLGRVGSYWDYAGSSVPAWVSGCTIPPYLNCIGTVFSSATYPALAAMIGTTLPDSRGRARFALNQTTARLSSAVSLAGDTLFAAGGDQNFAAHSHANTLIDPGHTHGAPNLLASNGAALGTGNTRVETVGPGADFILTPGSWALPAAVTGATVNNVSAGTGGSGNVPPGYIGGLTFIRAA